MIKRHYIFFLLILLLVNTISANIYAQQYLSAQEFVAQSIGEKAGAKVLWLDKNLRGNLKEHFARNFLDEALTGARIRYWQWGDRRVWVLQAIGRDKPITMGFALQNNKVSSFRILAYRESRGYEVRYPRFTSQLSDMSLTEEFKLSASIDNITGATLSVNAVKKTARLALYLNSWIDKNELSH